jgi:hypothetical protein
VRLVECLYHTVRPSERIVGAPFGDRGLTRVDSHLNLLYRLTTPVSRMSREGTLMISIHDTSAPPIDPAGFDVSGAR